MASITKKTTLVLAALVLASSVSAHAQSRGGGRFFVVPRGHVYAPFYYGPFWGAWGPYYPYGAYGFGGYSTADVRVQVVFHRFPH